ncbi:exported hypothetical protein [uncultured Desulfovibrio sp.]|uniref:Uncharacterized protein n=1 Tax=uncultured Desulfovibrio sp. TaxID=167968 RepID=A0A212KYC9_9BACT|nr:exported hypothetical protein [uncultured Desulfovibrio sp.]VZH32196.1 conserved exported protein of unknown function [Desulfovibrio sp. 86]
MNAGLTLRLLLSLALPFPCLATPRDGRAQRGQTRAYVAAVNAVLAAARALSK